MFFRVFNLFIFLFFSESGIFLIFSETKGYYLMFFLGRLKKERLRQQKGGPLTICYWAGPAFGKFHLQFPPREEIKEEFSLNIFWHFLGDFFLWCFFLLLCKFLAFEYSYYSENSNFLFFSREHIVKIQTNCNRGSLNMS